MPLVSLNPNDTTPYTTETMSNPASPEPPTTPALPTTPANSENGFSSLQLFSDVFNGCHFRYWAPTLGQGDAFVDPFASPGSGPKPVGTNVRRLTFKSPHVGIPAHRHVATNKIYTFIGHGLVYVFILIPGDAAPQMHTLHTPGQVLAIPPGHWHALFCVETKGHCSIVISTSQIPTAAPVENPDIIWEPDKPSLIANQPGQRKGGS